MTYEPVSVESLLTHHTWALRLARRLVREDDEAEDLVQRTWMAALRSPPGSERGARAWIRKVILNLARERHRRGKTRERYERAFPKVEGDVPDALEVLSRDEIRKMLSEQLLELAEPYRSVVLQRYYDGLSSVEIARRLGIPAGTVRWRLKVGLDQLRADLDRRAHGDRSRWVSALMLFAPAPDAPPAATDRKAPALERASPFLGTTGWVTLGSAGVLGLVLLARGVEWGERVNGTVLAGLDASAERRAADEVARVTTGAERFPLAADPGPEVASTPPTSGLSILVVDPEGAPVEAARILVASASGFEERITSDADGRAWLVVQPRDPGALGLPSTRGRVAVRALAAGREASALIHVAAPFTPEHEVRLVVGGPETRLTGRVVDRQGRAVPGAVLAWFDPWKRIENAMEGDFASPSFLTTVSDAEGRFLLAHLMTGSGNLGCFAPGFAYTSRVLELPGTSPVEILLERGARVSGTVRWPDGRPAANAIVGCEPPLKAAEWATGLPRYDADWRGFGESTRSDAQGRFLLEGVKAGRKRLLWARDEASGLVASTARLLENEHEERWDAQLSERSGLRLALVDQDGEPLPGWILHLRHPLEEGSWWIRRRPTDAQGRLHVTDCMDGEVYLDVFSPVDIGASYASRRLRPGPDEVRIEVETRATSSLGGCLLDALGEPFQRGQLMVHSMRTTLAMPVARDEHGNFEQRLAPGGYALVLELDQTATRLAQLVLALGENRALGTLTTPPLGTLRLDVTALKGGVAGEVGYSLFSMPEEGEPRGVLKLSSGPVDGEILLPMFPGLYRVLIFDGSPEPLAQIVRVGAHEETRVDVRR